MKLPLIYYGNPILRKKAALVEEINDDIRQLIEDMRDTMRAADGIGIAAPQVNRSLAIFFTCAPIRMPDDKWGQGVERLYINPKILWHSNEGWITSEGCLSIPKVYGDVPRPLVIRVEYMNLEGQIERAELSEYEARCFMHENDHINGTLFIDRITPEERKEIEPKLREVKKKYSK